MACRHSGGQMTPDEQYQANLAFLATRSNMQGMLSQLPQFPMTNLQLMPGAGGQLFGQAWDTQSQQWWALCSPEDPRAEAERDCDNLYTRDAKVFTLLGMGLGYFATAFAKRLEPWQRLVIWDTDATMFKAALHACDISPLFSDKHTDLHIGNEVVTQVEPWWLKLDAVEKLHIVLPFRASYTNGPNKLLYDAIMEKTLEMIRFHQVGLSTWRIFGGCIGDNDLRNMPEYFSTPGLLTLKDLWKDRPAVCVAAGPSLQKNLRYLLSSTWRDRVAVISAGTVYGLLHGMGIAPDIVTTIDFQRRNWTDQFQHLPLDPACPLVYLHSTYPQTVRRWPGPRFVATNASDTTGWIAKYSEPKGSAAEVQTVAHLNLKVALALGANPIILLGQDLAMPFTSHHAAGARAEDASPSECDEGAFFIVPDFEGKPVHTRHSFMSMKTVFERLVLENPDRQIVNCSEAGLGLAGAAHKPFIEMLQQTPNVPSRGELRQKLRSVFLDYKPVIYDAFWADWQQLQEWVNDLIGFAERLPGMAAEAEAVCEASITADMWQAAYAEDCETNQDVIDQVAMKRWVALLEQEAIIQARPAALGLFAIRRFDFLELMAEIPPKTEDVPTPLAMAIYNARRLLRVAAMIREEVPVLQRLIRETNGRLASQHQDEPLFASLPDGVVRKHYARQCYERGMQVLRGLVAMDEISGEAAQQLYLRYLWHTQQYDAAISLMQTWGFSQGKLARAQRHLAQWQTDVREAMEAYFASMGDQPQPQGEPWVYD